MQNIKRWKTSFLKILVENADLSYKLVKNKIVTTLK